MPEKKRYLVEGVYLDGNDGMPITGDYVAAFNEEHAQEIVTKVREKTGNWTCECVVTFEEHLAREYRRLANMEAMTLEDVENGWADTKDNLYYEDEDEEEEVDA